jgi:dienelactone hydrolase
MRKQTFFAAALSFYCIASQASAAVKTEPIEYLEGKTTLQGMRSIDDSSDGKRPAVLIVHDWMGVTDHTKSIAEDIASLGYVAFAVDIYGKGIRPADTTSAATEAGKFKSDRTLLRSRVIAGLETLKKDPRVDPNKIAAIGFCFGGTTVLELARTGTPIQGVVSFHGGLDSPTPEDGKKIKAKVLVLHGADDPFVKASDITAFQDEMRQGHVDWQMTYYGDAVHSFTQKKAGTDKTKGAAYNEPAARRSWIAMKTFLTELFSKK